MLSLLKHLYRIVELQTIMEKLVIRALYEQLMFFSDNGAEEIRHPAIAISEACKCCGRPRKDVREVFQAFEEHGLIKRVDHENFSFRMTESGADRAKVEKLVKLLTTS